MSQKLVWNCTEIVQKIVHEIFNEIVHKIVLKIVIEIFTIIVPGIVLKIVHAIPLLEGFSIVDLIILNDKQQDNNKIMSL